MNPKLKELFSEKEFWLLLTISLPGLMTGMAESVRACYDALLNHNVHYDVQAAYAMLTGLPIVAYLGIGRQIARSGAAQGVGTMLAGEGAIVNATNPPAEATIPMPPPESIPEAPITPMGVDPVEDADLTDTEGDA